MMMRPHACGAQKFESLAIEGESALRLQDYGMRECSRTLSGSSYSSFVLLGDSCRKFSPPKAACPLHRAGGQAAECRCCNTDQTRASYPFVRLARRSRHCASENDHPLAPCRMEFVLATQVQTGSTADSGRTAGADSQDGLGEPGVGRRADRQ